MTGTVWEVEDVVKVIDGDSVRVVRSRIDLLGDDPFRITDPDPGKGALIRLVWVNTPEVGQDGYAQARKDLADWITAHELNALPLRMVTYGREPRGGRILGDLTDRYGNSASQWLMTVRGWPPYQQR